MRAITDESAALASLRALASTQPSEAAAQLVALAPSLSRAEHIQSASDIVSVLASAEHGLPTRRIAVIGNVTLNGIAAATTVALAGEGFIAATYIGSYGALDQEVIDLGSGLYAANPEVVVIAPRPEIGRNAVGKDPGEWVDREIASWRGTWDLLAQRLPGVRILHHLNELPDDDLTGPLERRLRWSPRRLATLLNERLLSEAPGFVHLIDIEDLASSVGRSNWRDPRLWFHGKVPFSPKYLAEYKSAVAGGLRRALGRARKALIVDLDNTLWGGVIGDDGIAGIALGPESPVGEAFRAFCDHVKMLGERGVILGICSKNDPEIALRVFDEHSHMPLRRDDFAVVRCSWDDKATSLRQIAGELNIDLSALVFVDDNEAECELVRRELPSVAVVALTGDPSTFRRKLAGLRLFEMESISFEDTNRRASYRARSEAELVRTSTKDLGEYLDSLKMRGRIWCARDEDLTRLTQMEGKTNQFNLTTRRWSADQLKAFLQSEDHEVLCFKLADRFADHGLVSSAIVQYSGREARIVSWLMSCRVFSRGAEEFILNSVLERAEGRGAATIVGEYIPTSKNGVVADLYTRLGFEADSGVYKLAVRPDASRQTFIRSE